MTAVRRIGAGPFVSTDGVVEAVTRVSGADGPCLGTAPVVAASRRALKARS
ncbi:hypothetical protein [Streptomyces sp. NPDC049879]|uniref:hypothetical protein n=1 Tax=Streptomyces sp. NPDC049879 TaxID=3365598 RepID=UPI0037A96040